MEVVLVLGLLTYLILKPIQEKEKQERDDKDEHEFI